MSSLSVPFQDRADAGRKLAQAIPDHFGDDPVVLALPRGGVPVGVEVARSLQAPLDLLIVRKISAPGQPEVGIGAVVDGGEPHTVLDEQVVRSYSIPPGYLEDERQKQLSEVDRRRTMYRGLLSPVDIRNRNVIVVDDGAATGVTLKGCVEALTKSGVASIRIALPVASQKAVSLLKNNVEDFICLHSPANFKAVSTYYEDFTQVEDEEVARIIQDAGNE